MVKIKQKNKKLIGISSIIFIFLFFFFLYFLFSNKEYEITYTIDNTEIIEKYDDENQIYQFLLKKDNQEYVFKQKHKHISKKRLVNKIEVLEDDNTICLIPVGDKLNFYPLCIENNELISYQQIENKNLLPKKFYKEIKEEKEEYNNIQIHYLNNKKYFIWNYKGFDIIDKKKKKSINLFEEDIYNIPLAFKNNNTILIADYKQKYNFNKFYIINTKNNRVKEIESKKNLSFESYILGSYNDNYYFVDKKNKKEYEISVKNKSVEDITKKNRGKTLENGVWKDISINKLSQGNIKFSNNVSFDYQVIDNKLYLCIDNYRIRISNLEVKDIIEIDEDNVYYLVNDKLYVFNPLDGETLIMSYFEWNFNYKNMIYVV